MTEKSTVLIVDTDPDFLSWAEKHLTTPTTQIIGLTNSQEALDRCITDKPDLLLAEYHLKPISGMELLKQVRMNDPNAMVVLTTGFPATSAVIEAMKLGAFDFLRKESLPYDLRPVVEEALRASEEVQTTHDTPLPIPNSEPGETIIGTSIAMQEVFKMIGKVSRSDAPVLTTGESGSGKEVVANAIHKYSRRGNREYMAINCAAIPGNLLESELFGHEKGSFTGASAQRIGRFEECDGGTLFLDEIGDMPMPVQSKILRMLQQGEFSRLGGNKTLHADVRIIAATNKDLEAEVERGNFREDLFYRLNVVRVHIPPLRHRREDVRPLAEFFLKNVSSKKGGPALRLSEDAITLLESYNWPGNVRELENTIQRASVLATTNVLLPKDIPLGTGPTKAEAPAPEETESTEITTDSAIEHLFKVATASEEIELLPWIEREFTIRAMKKTGDNQLQAAKLLGITRATLRKRLERYP
jgi:DNA-binding NtrC family response regulator